MNDKKLYEQILGITSPWHVEQVELKLENGQVLIAVEGSSEVDVCPECGQRCRGIGGELAFGRFFLAVVFVCALDVIGELVGRTRALA